MSQNIIIRLAEKNDIGACYAIRREVFIEEQSVPEEIEMDQYDAEALHFIAFGDARPMATARVLLKDNGKTAKIGRVAVVKFARGLGIGKKLMLAIEQSAPLRDVSSFVLDAQTHALDFYQKLGFLAFGEEFMDAGIPHFKMKKTRNAVR